MTDDLRKRVLPVNVAVKDNLKNRDDRARQLKRSNRSRPEDAEEERSLRTQEASQVQALIEAHQELKDLACPSGLYELTGMVTHKGPSADSGHYIGWTRNDAAGSYVASGEEEWFKFDGKCLTKLGGAM
jgi:ubiquitin carboxyl-terminal hydrolase 14